MPLCSSGPTLFVLIGEPINSAYWRFLPKLGPYQFLCWCGFFCLFFVRYGSYDSGLGTSPDFLNFLNFCALKDPN